MNYRKFKANQIFTGLELLQNKDVLVAKPDGEIVSIVKETEAGEGIETFKGIISPGFINAHCHLELSHMKGLIPEKTGLIDFAYKIITNRNFKDEEILEAIKKAEQEMLQACIVAAGDICNTTFTLAQKLKHNLAYYNFIETSGWSPAVSQQRWQISKTYYEEFNKENLPASIVPHAPYSVSEDLWQKIILACKGKTITIHNQETLAENELFINGSGNFLKMYERMGIKNPSFSPANKSSLQTYLSKLSKAASLILVHNIYTSQSDINYVINNKVDEQLISFCLCPNANLYIENRLPEIDMFLKNNCSIVIGTDSLASNHSLNILNEMKTIQKYFPLISLETMLGWATINGARALQMQKVIGSFEKGKRPGIILIENLTDKKLTKDSVARRIL